MAFHNHRDKNLELPPLPTFDIIGEMVRAGTGLDRIDISKSGGWFDVKGIITVLGKDKVGIIAKVCAYLAENNVNILDISQTIIQGYFNMMMIVDVSAAPKSFETLVEELHAAGTEIGVEIKLQHEDIFNIMHRI